MTAAWQESHSRRRIGFTKGYLDRLYLKPVEVELDDVVRMVFGFQDRQLCLRIFKQIGCEHFRHRDMLSDLERDLRMAAKRFKEAQNNASRPALRLEVIVQSTLDGVKEDVASTVHSKRRWLVEHGQLGCIARNETHCRQGEPCKIEYDKPLTVERRVEQLGRLWHIRLQEVTSVRHDSPGELMLACIRTRYETKRPDIRSDTPWS